MPDDNVVNPLSPPAPDFTPPSANVEISQEARSFAQAPVSAWVNGALASRPPTDAEQVARLSQARELIGDRFWSEKGPAPPTAEQRAAADVAAVLGVKPGATASDYRVSLPPGAPPESGDRIRGFLAGLEFTGPHGNHIAQRIVSVGREVGTMSQAEQDRWSATQQRQIAEWATRKGWDLPKVQADVAKMLAGRDAAVATLAMGDSELFIRLAMHVENVRKVRGGG